MKLLIALLFCTSVVFAENKFDFKDEIISAQQKNIYINEKIIYKSMLEINQLTDKINQQEILLQDYGKHNCTPTVIKEDNFWSSVLFGFFVGAATCFIVTP